mmetsp:Transcript_20657/g.49640  ORF Transcript_20657/g.49640 Transcript_20657/m.49640 type:complete len:200 (-) Transcript_20657:1784-2383(-)
MDRRGTMCCWWMPAGVPAMAPKEEEEGRLDRRGFAIPRIDPAAEAGNSVRAGTPSLAAGATTIRRRTSSTGLEMAARRPRMGAAREARAVVTEEEDIIRASPASLPRAGRSPRAGSRPRAGSPKHPTPPSSRQSHRGPSSPSRHPRMPPSHRPDRHRDRPALPPFAKQWSPPPGHLGNRPQVPRIAPFTAEAPGGETIT